ncbi:MAG: hypothetical protein WCJ39_02815 [bacterium]
MICEINDIYIPKNEEEEYEVKKILGDPEEFTETDQKRIEEYNVWIKSI